MSIHKITTTQDIMARWAKIHCPSNSTFQGRAFVGYRTSNSKGIGTLACLGIDQIPTFLSGLVVYPRLDYYITSNVFAGVKRNSDGVFGLHNIVIDIDCHDPAYLQEMPLLCDELIWRCNRDLWGLHVIPTPNSIVYTGRGVQLWWAITPISIKTRYWVRRCQEWFLDSIQCMLDEYPSTLSAFAIDRASSTGLERYYRLPGTYNTKCGRYIDADIIHDSVYSVQDFLEQFVPSEYAVPMRPQKLESDTQCGQLEHIPLAPTDGQVIDGATKTLSRRLLQLMRLRALRNAEPGEETRDLYCTIVYSTLLAICPPTEAWTRLLAFNSGFKQPLPIYELRQTMSTAGKKHYKFTNRKIIDWLKITLAEQVVIGMESRRHHNPKPANYTRDTIRRVQKEDRNNKILALRDAGHTQTEIANELQISRNTVAKVIKQACTLSPDESDRAKNEHQTA